MPYYPVPFVAPSPLVALDPALNAYPSGRHLGNPGGLTAVEADLIASNIIYGLNIFGVSGTHGYLDRWVPATIVILAPVTAIETPDRVAAENIPIASAHVETCGDLPASGIKLLEPAVTLTDAEAIETVDQTDGENCPLLTHFDLIQVLEGAVADDGGATTNETAAAKNATANDMTLLPAVPVTGDAYYFGSSYKFDEMILNIGTPGNGVWTIAWEYYDVDTTWHALAGLTDGTLAFKAAAGNRSVTFTKDANWTAVAVGGVGPFYWIRAVVTFTSIVTQPKGTQAWYKITI